MKKQGVLNREISDVLARSGHMDTLCVCDAGFPIPLGVRTVDIALSDNNPGIIETLKEILKDFCVEKIILAEETKDTSPTMFSSILNLFDGIEVEVIKHADFKIKSRDAKAIIRTGEFTCFSNVILVGGTDEKRWYRESSC